MLELENYIPSYPLPTDEDLGYEIFRRKEFQDLRLEPSEDIPTSSGTPLNHQEMMSRFISPETPYDRNLIFHGVGTGKCILPGQKVITSRGLLPIEKIWSQLGNHDTVIDDGQGLWAQPIETFVALSYNPLSEEGEKKMVPGQVEFIYRQHVAETIVSLTFESGKTIEITRVHKLFNGEKWTNEFTLGMPIYTYSYTTQTLSPDPIISIRKEHYTGYVYDLSVKKYHNFVCNAVLCHNTCTSSLIVEHFKRAAQNTGENFKPALVIVKNDDLMINYRKEVADRCTKDEYLPLLTKDEKAREAKGEKIRLTQETKKRRIKAAMSKAYEMVSMETFFKKLPSNQVLKSKYSNRIIIIDEAHNLRIQPGKEGEDTVKLYQNAHRFLHAVENSRILLLTGTPIWDRVSEIASIMNLLLPLTNQLPTGTAFTREYFKDNKLRPEKIPVLKEMFSGLVSYLRPMMTTAERREMGILPGKNPLLDHVTVFPCIMSDEQARVSTAARNDVVEVRETRPDGKEAIKKVKGGTILKAARDAANFVFPVFSESGKVKSVSYDSKEFKNQVEKRDKRKNKITYELSRPLRSEIEKNLYTYSCKFAAIISLIQASPNELVYIYDEFVTGGGGSIMLGLCLQAAKEILGKRLPYHYTWAKKARDIAAIPKDEKSKRFVVITSNPETTSESTEISKMLDIINSPENRYGQKCQVVIGSKKTAEGFTLKNFRQVHVVMPSWNIPSLDQALGRVFRTGSHNALPEGERYIKIYRHVTMTAEKEGCSSGNREIVTPDTGFPLGKCFSDFETIDAYIYSKAEKKDFRNTQIHRLLKEVAWDCSLNYKRNVLVTDEMGTRECDYQQCNYVCEGFQGKNTGHIDKKGRVWNYTLKSGEEMRVNYDLYYSSSRVREIMNEIVRLFSNYFSLQLDLIQALLSVDNSEKQLLLHALETLISSRVLIKNRFGFNSYLREDGNIYFLEGTVSSQSRGNYSSSYYEENMLVYMSTDLSIISEVKQLALDKEKVCEFAKKPTIEKYNALFHKTKVVLLEAAYKLSVMRSGQDSGGRLSEVLDVLKPELSKNIFVTSDNTVVHAMYGSEFTGTSYRVELKTDGSMRRWDPVLKEWTYLGDPEREEKYIREIREEQKEERTEFAWEENPYGMVGTIEKDNKFRIITKQLPGQKRQGTGQVCATIPREKIVDYIQVLDKDFEPTSKMKKGELCKILEAKLREKKLFM